MIYTDQLFTIIIIESAGKELIVGRFLEIKMVPTQNYWGCNHTKFKSKRDV